jgi:hypothetical protein
MLSLIKTLVRILFLTVIVYTVLLTFYILDDDQLGLVRKADNDRVIYIFNDTYNFVWYGFTPWLYKIDKIPLQYSTSIEADVAILPGVVDSSGSPDIRIPLEISYKINRDSLPEPSFFESSRNRKDYIVKSGREVCSFVLNTYIEPDYKRREIERNEETILKKIKTGLVNDLKKGGIITESIESSGSIILPSLTLYREAVLKDKEIKEIAFRNKIQEMHLKNNLEKERISSEAYYEKLGKIGDMIKDNPGILKYIYIDKLAGNIKVIVTSEKNAMPVIFGQDQDDKDSDLKKEIDNLR